MGINMSCNIKHQRYLKEKYEKRDKRLAKVLLNMMKCSNACRYAYNVKGYCKGNKELIGAECKYNIGEFASFF